MRILILALAIGAAACGETTTVNSDGDSASASGGYTMEIRASEGEQTYLVTTPDGRVVGARAAEGASALMQADSAQRLAADPPPQGEAPPEVMALRLPGFDLRIGAEDGAEGEGAARVDLSMGADGENITVNADEGGPGEADDRAHVRITGADEASVREFIEGADELSPEVKAQMLAELGISAAAAE